jgi:hypothetical protein
MNYYYNSNQNYNTDNTDNTDNTNKKFKKDNQQKCKRRHHVITNDNMSNQTNKTNEELSIVNINITTKHKIKCWILHFNNDTIGYCKCCDQQYPISMPPFVRNFLKIKKKEIHEEYPPADFFLNNQIEINTSKSQNYISNANELDDLIVNSLKPVCFNCKNLINQYISETIIPMAIDGINPNNDYQDVEEYDKYIISYLKNVKKCYYKKDNIYCCKNIQNGYEYEYGYECVNENEYKYCSIHKNVNKNVNKNINCKDNLLKRMMKHNILNSMNSKY